MGAGRTIVILGLLCAAGAGAAFEREAWLPGLLAQLPGHAAERAGEAARDRAVPVVAVPVVTADRPVYVGGVGTARPVNSVLIRAQVSGRIAEIDFAEGQDLKKGDPIAKLDDALYRAQRDQALAKKAQDEAVLVNAELELQRDERLVRSGNMTEQLLGNQRALVAQNRAQVAADQAAVEAAEAQLAYTTITAPIDGRTGLRGVDVGNLVSSGDAAGIVTLSQIRPIAVVFSVPQQQLARVNAASANGPLRVEALSAEGGAVLAEGRLTVVDNQVDPATGTVRLKAEFPNETLALWPGAFVDARLLVETRRDLLTVPSAAVQHGPTGAYAYVVSADDHAQLRPITVGLQDDRTSAIEAGLGAGERVVISGFARLQDGALVRVASPEEADPARLELPPAEGGGKGGKHRKGGHGGKPATGGAAPAAAGAGVAPSGPPAPLASPSQPPLAAVPESGSTAPADPAPVESAAPDKPAAPARSSDRRKSGSGAGSTLASRTGVGLSTASAPAGGSALAGTNAPHEPGAEAVRNSDRSESGEDAGGTFALWRQDGASVASVASAPDGPTGAPAPAVVARSSASRGAVSGVPAAVARPAGGAPPLGDAAPPSSQTSPPGPAAEAAPRP